MHCGYLGPKGTYSELAALQYKKRYNSSVTLEDFSSFYNLFEALDQGDCHTILIPIENSIGGFVDTVLDLMTLYPQFTILSEFILPIDCHLLAEKPLELDQITHIASHPQPISQSAKFLHSNFPHAKLIQCSSSASAAKLMKDDPNQAMAIIGSSHLADSLGLTILSESIQDHSHNQTRFILIGKEKIENSSQHASKTTIVCSMSHDQPGSLYTLLGFFEERRINLTHITSRPTKDALGQYLFFIDYNTPVSPNDQESLLKELRDYCLSFYCLGSFSSYPLD